MYEFQIDYANGKSYIFDNRDDYERMLNTRKNSTISAIGAAMKGVNIEELLYKDLLKVTLDAAYTYYSKGMWK